MFRRRVPLSFVGRVREMLWPRKGFSRLYSYLVQRVLRMPGSAYSLASGFACGVSVSFTPLIGFHLAFCWSRFFMRANMCTALGTLFAILTFPLIFVLPQAPVRALSIILPHNSLDYLSGRCLCSLPILFHGYWGCSCLSCLGRSVSHLLLELSAGENI